MFKQLMEKAFELDKLKHVYRESDTLDGSKKESSAEHSWQVATLALLLREHGDPNVNIDRVIRMLLVHDVGEIGAGDVSLYKDTDPQARFDAEKVFIEQLLADHNDLIALWHEFESGESLDARYANAMDRIAGVLSSLFNEESCWAEKGMTVSRIIEKNRAIERALPSLWGEFVELVEYADSRGRVG